MSLTVSKLNSYYNISYCENNDIGGGSWSISLNIAWGGGFNLELGRVWDNKGGTHRFLTIGPSIGVDISIGILQKNIYNPNFSVNQYQGYCSSIDIGISVLDWVIIGGDNYEETWYSKFGYNYGEEGWGISLGLPLGAVWNMGKTWTF